MASGRPRGTGAPACGAESRHNTGTKSGTRVARSGSLLAAHRPSVFSPNLSQAFDQIRAPVPQRRSPHLIRTKKHDRVGPLPRSLTHDSVGSAPFIGRVRPDRAGATRFGRGDPGCGVTPRNTGPRRVASRHHSADGIGPPFPEHLVSVQTASLLAGAALAQKWGTADGGML